MCSAQPWGHHYYAPIYFFPYWAVYIASAILLFFVCIEVFRSALAALPGLMKFGIVVFRWAIAGFAGSDLLVDFVLRTVGTVCHSRYRQGSDAFGEHP